MGRSSCCSQDHAGLNRGTWTTQEDKLLLEYIGIHGDENWRDVATGAGLKRCRKSCRNRWKNCLRPGIKRGNISPDEEDLIIRMYDLVGKRWSLIAGRLPGRTDNQIKHYWNNHLKKKVPSIQESQNNTMLNSPAPLQTEMDPIAQDIPERIAVETDATNFTLADQQFAGHPPTVADTACDFKQQFSPDWYQQLLASPTDFELRDLELPDVVNRTGFESPDGVDWNQLLSASQTDFQ